MRCVIPSISKVSLANIILLTLFVNNSFELEFCFTLYITRVTSAIKELFVAAILRFPKGRHYLEWNLSWSYHNPFRATLPTSLLITHHGAIVASMKQFFFHGLWARSYFKGFSTSKCCSFQVFILLNVSTFFIVFYKNKHNFIFFIFTRLQLFNYLSPRELFPPAQYGASTFSTFRKMFFSTLMETFISFQKSFPLYLTNPIRALIIRWT